MKKAIALLTAGFMTAALFSASPLSALAAEITQENAKSIALKDAGIEESNTVYLQVKQKQEDGKSVYEVKFFTSAYAEYEYTILIEDGKILKIDYDAEAAIAKSQRGKDTTAVVTLEKAKQTALTHAGQKEENVTVTKAKTEYDDGRQIHDIKFYTDDFQEYEFEIDAVTGMILSWEYEAEMTDTYKEILKQQKEKPASGDTTASGTANGLADVKAAALKKAGLKEDAVTWGRVHQEYDDGRSIYEGKFFSGQLEYEFEIDADTLKIIDWDVENLRRKK